MTDYFTSAADGNNAYDGLAPLWTGVHGPKATISAGDALLVAGDNHHIRPGVYREQVTWGASGGNAYQVGTVTLTNGDETVQGVGTLWLANVAANYMFHVTLFASGADGVTNGTATFTSATGNFQASMVGYTIQINTRGAYKIANVGGAGTITLSDPNGLGWPAAGVGLTYSVMSGMGPFDVASVTDNTHLELDKPWNGPTLTGIAYTTYNPIRTIGDVTGKIWGVGGTVRITGSDDDITATRASCIAPGARAYRVLRGFSVDLTTAGTISSSTSPSYITIEDCTLQHSSGSSIDIRGAGQLAITIRRCVSFGKSLANVRHILFLHSVNISNACHLVSNCYFLGGAGNSSAMVLAQLVGGITVRNCTCIACGAGVKVTIALTVGQTVSVLNSLFQGNGTVFSATVIGEITENFNSISDNIINYVNVAAGANTVTRPPIFAMPLLSAGQAGISGFRLPPPMLGELSQWSQVKALTGFGEAPADLFGIKRPATSSKNSWGAVQYQNQLRDAATVRTGTASLKISNAGRQQIIIPVEAVNTTISVYCYREANYVGVNPQMILKQPGQADIVVTDAGGVGVWNLLTHTWIPSATPNWIVIELVSNNAALAGAYGCFFDDLLVSPLDTDTMEAWSADVQHINYAEELVIPTAAFSPVGGTIVGA